MIQLLLLLWGSRAVRRRWWAVLAFGLFWMAMGLFCMIDALDSRLWFPPALLAIPLGLDAAWSLLSSFSMYGTARKLRMSKAAVCLCVILILTVLPHYSGVVIGILIGVLLIVDACWRAASAIVVHFETWRRSFAFACFEFVLGVWSLVPWPTQWEGAVGIDVGGLMVLSAACMCGLAMRIRTLPPDMSILPAMSRGWAEYARPRPASGPSLEDQEPDPGGTVVVHVWTPTAGLAPLSRGISRYVAAPDKHGVISTGHSALELAPDVYISHYPAVEIDRSGAEFARILRATRENDVPGLFQPSYEQEQADWSPSTKQIPLPGLNTRAIREFWKNYRQDSTYNLTNRNCSSVVTKALDMGLDGLFEKEFDDSPAFFLHLIMTSEFRVAGFMRHRAAAMAWTPGIVLDYVRALSHILSMKKNPLPNGNGGARRD